MSVYIRFVLGVIAYGGQTGVSYRGYSKKLEGRAVSDVLPEKIMIKKDLAHASCCADSNLVLLKASEPLSQWSKRFSYLQPRP